MSHSALDPIRIPVDFWVRADVSEALERRVISELFRGAGPGPDWGYGSQ